MRARNLLDNLQFCCAPDRGTFERISEVGRGIVCIHKGGKIALHAVRALLFQRHIRQRRCIPGRKRAVQFTLPSVSGALTRDEHRQGDDKLQEALRLNLWFQLLPQQHLGTLDCHSRRQGLQFQARCAFGRGDFRLRGALDRIRLGPCQSANAFSFQRCRPLRFQTHFGDVRADVRQLSLRFAASFFRGFAGTCAFGDLLGDFFRVRVEIGERLAEAIDQQAQNDSEIDPAEYLSDGRVSG